MNLNFVTLQLNTQNCITTEDIQEALRTLGLVININHIAVRSRKVTTESHPHYVWLTLTDLTSPVVRVLGATSHLDRALLDRLRTGAVVDRYVGPLLLAGTHPSDEDIFAAAIQSISHAGFSASDSAAFNATVCAPHALRQLRLRLTSNLAGELSIPTQSFQVDAATVEA